MLVHYIGEFAALGTAICWAISALSFTSAGRMIGSFSTNFCRVFFGCVFLAVLHFFVFQRLFPVATVHQALLLGASGLIGLVVGDTFLFKSYIYIGPRIALLIFNINPFLTAFFATFTLGEKLPPLAWLGMFITMGGTIWVMYEEQRSKKEHTHGKYAYGVAFAILAAVSQSTAYVMAKPALIGTDGLSPMSATFIRLVAGMVSFFVLGAVTKKLKGITVCFENWRAMKLVIFGSVLGPFLGIWLSLIALKLTKAGIAATLMSTLPVVILPMAIVVYKERVSWRAWIGTLITVVGIYILFNS